MALMAWLQAASQVGLEILRKGGNAADAAVATAAALNVTEPSSTGIGGDCFCLFYDAKTKKVHGLNGSGRSPKKLTLQYIRDVVGIGDDRMPHSNINSATVPGAAAGWIDTVDWFGSGKLKMIEILKPAIDLAENGYLVSEISAWQWKNGEDSLLKASPNAHELLIDGRAPVTGEIIYLPTLARTFRDLAEKGEDGFYKGRVAQAIVDLMESKGGLMSLEDLESHTTTRVEPISINYKGVTVWECPPNGQGITALIALGILESLQESGKIPEIQKLEHNSAEYLHALIESLRLAFADSTYYVTDPDVHNVPVKELLSKEYLSSRAKLFDPTKASVDVQKGSPINSSDTVYFSVVDKEGNACSFINSNYLGFGTAAIPKGCGFSLQSRGVGFVLKEGHPNCLEPSKRPYHTIIPSMVTKGNELWLTFGVMGGFMQPQGHVQVILNLLHHSMNLQTALDAPRICIGTPKKVQEVFTSPIFVEEGIDENVVQELRKLGHDVKIVKGWNRKMFGRGQIIERTIDKRSGKGVLAGGSDLREEINKNYLKIKKLRKLTLPKKENMSRSSFGDVTEGVNNAIEFAQNISSVATSSNLESVKQVVNVVGAVGEAVKPFVPLIGIVTVLVGEIIKVYENAQYNKKICNAFLDRVEAAQSSVKYLQRRKEENLKTFQDETYYKNFLRFTEVLRQVKAFLEQVTQLHGYKRFLNAGSVKDKFESLAKDFDSVMSDLHFTLTVSAQRQSEIDQKSLKEDLDEMNKFLDAIHGNIVDNNKQLNTVLQEVLIIKGQIDSMDNNKNAQPNDNPIKAAQISPTELEDPMYPKKTDRRGKAPYIIKKILKKPGPIDVACKTVTIPNEEEKPQDYQKVQGLFTILGKLRESDNIIKFYGLSTVDGAQVMVLEWAELGSLKEVYEKFDIGWRAKVEIALEICRGLTFLHSCLILHHDIQIVHWLAPEKLRYGPRQSYNFKCEIFSFGMLLWELAFERVPYEKWDMSKVRSYVLDGGRENIRFGETDSDTKSLQEDYAKIIRGAWEDDPLLRSSLQNIFLQLDRLYSQHPSSLTESGLFPSKTIDFDGSLKQGQKPISVSDEDVDNSQINEQSQASVITQIMTLDEGIKAHKAKDHKTAWTCFQANAELKNSGAKYWKGYYLWEGYGGYKDRMAAAKLFKEAADEGVPDAQLRYAFSLVENKTKFNKDEFIRYLKLAADNSNPTAQFNLGDMYINGKLGVTKDPVVGVKYLKLAALNRHPKAGEVLKGMKIDIYAS
ncbi:16794_t:CDS:10 [Entrophospora sp. SA101]|nr:16794_t:CDS:10 [Entrophospora sp. SA101]